MINGGNPNQSDGKLFKGRNVLVWPPLWSRGQEFLATDPEHPEFDSQRYQIIWEVVGLERGLLSPVSITEELLECKSSGSGSRKPRLTAVGIRCADHVAPSILKS
jgi:hypothetical protein